MLHAHDDASILKLPSLALTRLMDKSMALCSCYYSENTKLKS